MWIAQRGDDASFTFQVREATGVRGERARQHLDRDVAPQFRVVRAIDLTHPPTSEERSYLDGSNPPARKRDVLFSHSLRDEDRGRASYHADEAVGGERLIEQS